MCVLCLFTHTQGEDVVAGIRTPEPIERLSETLPEAYAQLIKNCDLLEAHYKDMQVELACFCVFGWLHVCSLQLWQGLILAQVQQASHILALSLCRT